MKKFYEFMTPENYKEALDALAEAIEKIEIQKIPSRVRFLITIQLVTERVAIRTTTSRIAKASERGSGVDVWGCIYPDSNSGLGNRCTAKVLYS